MSARDLLAVLHQQPSDPRVAALKRLIPLSTVQHVLRLSGRGARHGPCLPLWLVVWIVLGMGLFAADSLRVIFKRLPPFLPGATPASHTLAAARLALGLLPLRQLARAVVRLLCAAGTPGAFYKGMRLMAWDGFVLDLFDSPANDHAFGRPQSGRAAGTFPQARILALCETGSHAFYRWLVKPCRRGEIKMAGYLLAQLEEGMLLLWDRNFLSYDNVARALARRAHVLARIKSGQVIEPTQELPDGSYLAKMYPTGWQRKKGRSGLVVRVIEYTLNDPARPTKERLHRLLSTLLDAET